jgi:DNA mismatch repair protein MutS2
MLQRAESYLGTGEQAGRELIERLNVLVRELEAERSETGRLLAEARRDREHRRRLLHELEEQKATLLAKTLHKGEQAVRKAEREVRQLLGRIPDAQQLPGKADVVAAVKQIKRQLRQEAPPPGGGRRPPQTVTPGEVLHVPDLGVDAIVLRTPVHGRIELDLQGKKLRLPAAQLEQYAPRRFADRSPTTARIRSAVQRDSASSRLLLVGQRVEAALPALERFLDDALLQGLREVEVVHGTGEGILRRAVRELLAGHRGISAFHAADSAQGGDNVTVVQMREQ